MQSIKERIQKIIEREGVTIARFSKETGIADPTVRNIVGSRSITPSYEVIYAICTRYKWLDANWLITGHGNMAREDNQIDPEKAKLIDTVKSQQETIRKQSDVISDYLKKGVHYKKGSEAVNIASDVTNEYKK